jgi:rhodanese-related sulfurtransferase
MAMIPDIASPEELCDFVKLAGDRLLVIDTRNPDATAEPGDQTSLAVAGLPSPTSRPQAKHCVWDRSTKRMPIPDVAKDTPIITHCGGGGRGQAAKEYLQQHGFLNVLNGGGPKKTECWKEFGDR